MQPDTGGKVPVTVLTGFPGAATTPVPSCILNHRRSKKVVAVGNNTSGMNIESALAHSVVIAKQWAWLLGDIRREPVFMGRGSGQAGITGVLDDCPLSDEEVLQGQPNRMVVNGPVPGRELSV
ncbi:hypothetical protein FKG94_21425 [Exilibacterium tricleocarpae]|uniref:Uncharacterized protein n=1 Tax=Exilibacterium tricleocarpae TaxID=2591008 RepID=A0A545T033_9GAMM|nr:hypothetical protein [Exilibacterium tricleocarpae]TQV70584.1 hypothetical protein FKG94_21425 [Exilibacterium tricleocarpae]